MLLAFCFLNYLLLCCILILDNTSGLYSACLLILFLNFIFYYIGNKKHFISAFCILIYFFVFQKRIFYDESIDYTKIYIFCRYYFSYSSQVLQLLLLVLQSFPDSSFQVSYLIFFFAIYHFACWDVAFVFVLLTSSIHLRNFPVSC